MVAVAAAPEELRIPPNNLGRPAVAGAVDATGVVLAVGQHGIRHALARFAPDLTGGRARVLASDQAAGWELSKLVPLPDGRHLICNVGRGSNRYLRGRTLDVAPADDLVRAPVAGRYPDPDPVPRDAFVVGDRLLLGHTARFLDFPGYQCLSTVPVAGGTPEPW